jgi:hypothetical protein
MSGHFRVHARVNADGLAPQMLAPLAGNRIVQKFLAMASSNCLSSPNDRRCDNYRDAFPRRENNLSAICFLLGLKGQCPPLFFPLCLF